MHSACKALLKKAPGFICFVYFLFVSFSVAGKPYNSVSFFVVAHEDDWQLFMGSHAKDAVEITGRKLVFIYVTAGDAGVGKNPSGNGKIPYFIARENGAIRSTGFLCRNVTDSTDDGNRMVCINGHKIPVRQYRNTVSYYLRMPDGGTRGEGYVSLRKLYKKSFLSLATIDGVNIYDGWQDVVATVREIISREATGSVEINVPDVSSRRNPGDHYDHYLAGVLALSASKNACYNNILYTGYNVVKCPPKLSAAEIAFKQSLLKNIGTELDGAGYPDCQDPWHMSFTENEYSVNEPDACNYPDSDIFYIRKFGLRQEDDEKDEGNYTCVLYPNPATSFLHLSVTDKERMPPAIRILDVYGNTKKTFGLSEVGYAWEMLLDIQELQSGVYFLEIASGNRKTVQRFLKT